MTRDELKQIMLRHGFDVEYDLPRVTQFHKRLATGKTPIDGISCFYNTHPNSGCTISLVYCCAAGEVRMEMVDRIHDLTPEAFTTLLEAQLEKLLACREVLAGKTQGVLNFTNHYHYELPAGETVWIRTDNIHVQIHHKTGSEEAA